MSAMAVGGGEGDEAREGGEKYFRKRQNLHFFLLERDL